MMRRRIALGSCVIIVLAGASLGLFSRTKKSQGPIERLRTTEVRPAAFNITLRVPGAIEAAKSTTINTWVQGAQIAWVMQDGSRVKKGDVIMRLNPTLIQKALSELEIQNTATEKNERDELTTAEKREQNSLTALEKSKEDFKMMQLQSSAAIEKAEADIAFLQKEVELAQAQYDKRKRLANEKLMALTEVDEAADELRSKQFNLAKATQSLDQAKKDAETNVEVKKFDLKKAELEAALAKSALAQTKLQVQRTSADRQMKLADNRKQLADCEIKTNTDGMLLISQIWDSEGFRAIRIGDSVRWAGQRMASIIDPGQMRVRCDINESDIERVHSGQKATVRVPAIGARMLEGAVTTIDNLAKQQRWWQGGTPGRQVFAAVIMLSDHEEKLRPGMGATVEIILEKVAKGLAVPLEAVFKKGDGYVVFQSDGKSYREIPVKVGKRNEMMAEIRGALKAGDKLACERPSAKLLMEAKGH